MSTRKTTRTKTEKQKRNFRADSTCTRSFHYNYVRHAIYVLMYNRFDINFPLYSRNRVLNARESITPFRVGGGTGDSVAKHWHRGEGGIRYVFPFASITRSNTICFSARLNDDGGGGGGAVFAGCLTQRLSDTAVVQCTRVYKILEKYSHAHTHIHIHFVNAACQNDYNEFNVGARAFVCV